jgi:hypothetical protein
MHKTFTLVTQGKCAHGSKRMKFNEEVNTKNKFKPTQEVTFTGG